MPSPLKKKPNITSVVSKKKKINPKPPQKEVADDVELTIPILEMDERPKENNGNGILTQEDVLSNLIELFDYKFISPKIRHRDNEVEFIKQFVTQE